MGMKDWVVKPVFEEKTKPHVTEMLCSVLEMRDAGEEQDLLARHVSRFGKKIKQVKQIEIQKLNNPPKMPLAFTALVFYF